MIYAVKIRCQTIEIYSNMDCLVNGLNKPSGILKAAFE